jgi:hypothetical protein
MYSTDGFSRVLVLSSNGIIASRCGSCQKLLGYSANLITLGVVERAHRCSQQRVYALAAAEDELTAVVDAPCSSRSRCVLILSGFRVNHYLVYTACHPQL